MAPVPESVVVAGRELYRRRGMLRAPAPGRSGIRKKTGPGPAGHAAAAKRFFYTRDEFAAYEIAYERPLSGGPVYHLLRLGPDRTIAGTK